MKGFILLLAFFMVYTGVQAQDVKFTAQATNLIELGENFRLVYSVNAKGGDLKISPISDFAILSGPSTSSSTSMQIINGQMTSSSSYSYTYILQATKIGKYSIPPATINVDGKQYKSNALTIEVVQGSKGNQGQKKSQTNNQGQTNQQAQKDAGNIKNEDLFVRVIVDKNSLYQGESVSAAIKVYSRVNLAGFENMKFPSFKGFFSQEIETPNQVNLQRENVNGQIYNVGVMKRVVLFPQKSGQLTIEPFELECVVRQQVRGKNMWDDFFGTYQNIKKKVTSTPITINVKPLPGNAPESFSGAVGKFNMKASVNTNHLKTNDGITLKIIISGSGNLKLVDTLFVKLPSDFERYDPKITNNFKNDGAGASGSKTFEYLIIPRHAGNFTIPPIEFTYFDLASKQYKTILSDEFNIKVDKGSESEDVTIVSGLRKEDVKYIGSDIRYIKKNEIKFKQKGSLLFGTWMFWLSYVIALAAFIALYILMREKIKQNANLALVKNKKANKVSKKRLKNAMVFLKQNDKSHFYNEVLKALWGYLSDKFGIPVAELSRETTLSHLEKYKIEKELTDKVMNLIENCEFAHFAPSSDAYQMDKIYADASDLIGELENKIGRM